LNGFLTVSLGLQPVIVTFATSFIYAGLALLLLPTPGGAIPRDYTNYYRNTQYLGIPISLIILMVLLLIWGFSDIVNTVVFFMLLAVILSSLHTGVPVTWVKISTYVLIWFLSIIGCDFLQSANRIRPFRQRCRYDASLYHGRNHWWDFF
jgi:ribose transport system permease protein